MASIVNNAAAETTTSDASLSVRLSSFNRPTNSDGTSTTDVLVSVNAPTMGTRPPTDICCVVDVSGSMGVECTNGDSESQGLSVLSVVKHACKTVVHSLTAQDRFTLVKYSTDATVVLNLTTMNAAGLKQAETAIDNLEENGQTNLWDGLLKGLEAVNDDSGRMKAVMLLTDGQPNISPPRGIVPMFKAYKESNETVCTVSTFGFGYNLDSALLEELAIEGQGMYAFIPDGSFVGTAFVNATSNILSTAARQVTAKVSNIIDFEKDLSKVTTTGVDHVKASWGIQVPLGAVMFGQTKDFVISVPSDLISSNQQMRVDVDYLQSGSLEKQIASIEGIENTSDEEVLVQGARVALVALLRDIRKNAKVDNPSEFIPKVTQMSTEVKSLMGAVSIQDDERLSDIAKDLDGQITEATSRSDWYKKWGRHYLPSLAIAHSLQQCHNFKDPGVQHYGGPLFTALRETAEQIFVKLPPPQPPKRPTYGGYGYGYGASSAAAAPSAPVDMSAYYNRGGGCFTAKSLVTLSDGVTTKRIDEIKAGDLIQTFKKDANQNVVIGVGTVKFVTEMELNTPALLVTLPGGLEITAWHPVLVNQSWVFPATIAQQLAAVHGQNIARYHDLNAVSSVYNLALDDEVEGQSKWHGAMVNGLPTITLGHGIENDDVASHDYYGTQDVIRDMESLPRNAKGYVMVPPPVEEITTQQGFVSAQATPIACD